MDGNDRVQEARHGIGDGRPAKTAGGDADHGLRRKDAPPDTLRGKPVAPTLERIQSPLQNLDHFPRVGFSGLGQMQIDHRGLQ